MNPTARSTRNIGESHFFGPQIFRNNNLGPRIDTAPKCFGICAPADEGNLDVSPKFFSQKNHHCILYPKARQELGISLVKI